MKHLPKKIFITLLFITATAFLNICYSANYDISPPDVSDLIVKYEEIPAEENAFTYFEHAGQIVVQRRESDEYIFETINDDNYDPAKVERCLADSKDIFELMEQGLKCRKMQFPKIEMSFDATLPYLSSFRDMARIESNNAYHLFRKGFEKEGMDASLRAVKFGLMMQDAKGPLINCLVGIAIKAIGREKFRTMLAMTSLKPENLKPYIKLLDDGSASKSGLADAFKMEFMFFAKTVDDMTFDREFLDKLALLQEKTLLTVNTVPTSYSFQKNRTKLLYAETIRKLIANASPPYSDTSHVIKIKASFFDFIPVPNRLGIEWHNAISASLSKVIVQLFNDIFNSGATQLSVALECYRLDKGKLPEKLDMLMPDYIDKIPLDPFDMKPLRYSNEKKIIYSVGEDLKDDGGPMEEEWSINTKPGKALMNAKDPAVRIE